MMFTPIYGTIALLGIFVIGYILLAGYTRLIQLDTSDKLILPPLFFFANVTIIYLLNYFIGGKIFSERIFFLLITTAYLLMHILPGYRNIRRDLYEFKSTVKDRIRSIPRIHLTAFILIFLISVAVAIVPMMEGARMAGDTKRHVMRTLQLLNGFPLTHFPPYKGVPHSYYPFLSHAAMAYLVRLVGIHYFDAYFAIHFLQAVLLPLGVFVLVYRITKNFWLSLLAVVLITLYGGHHTGRGVHSLWFNTAIQRVTPSHIGRTLSLALFPVFLYLFIRSVEEPGNRVYKILSGIGLGLMGLCHPYAFVFMGIFLTSYALLNMKSSKMLGHCMGILLVGLSISMLAYANTIFQHLFSEPRIVGGYSDPCRLETSSKPIGQVFLTSWRFLNHHGIVGLVGILSIISIRRSRYYKLCLSLIVTVLVILIATYLKEFLVIHSHIRLPYHPTQHKFAKCIFIVFVIIGSVGIKWYVEKAAALGRLGGRLLIILPGLILVVPICLGIYTTFLFSINLAEKTWQRRQLFRREDHLSNVIRRYASSQDVIAVPDEMSKLFPCLTGLDVLFTEHPRAYSYCRRLANGLLFPSRSNRGSDAADESSISAEAIEAVLFHHGVRYIVVPGQSKDFYLNLDYMTFCDTAKWQLKGQGRKHFAIFRVNLEALSRKRSASKWRSWAQDDILSPEIAYKTLGYYPLNRIRYLRPRILKSRGMNVSGLTWGHGALWMGDERRRNIYQINSVDGSVMSSIKGLRFQPVGLAWDGEGLWTLDLKGRLRKLHPETGKMMTSLKVGRIRPSAIAWGNGALWAVDRSAGMIHRIDADLREIVLSVKCPDEPISASWKEGFLWILLSDFTLLRMDIEKESDPIAYASPSYEITRLAWGETSLWGYDKRSSALIELQVAALRSWFLSESLSLRQ